MTNKVIDRYSRELEMSDDLPQSGLLVRCIATNTDDDSSGRSYPK